VLLMRRPRALDGVASDLALEWVGSFSYETVARLVNESYDELVDRSPANPFLIVFAERFARERLEALAQAEGLRPKTVPELLFVCVNNAGRSVMAAALVNHRAGGRVHVRSAGRHPAGDVHDHVRAVLAEVGIDVSSMLPRPLSDEVVAAADVVVTMGCGDACPVYPNIRYVDWAVEDPAGRPLDAVRRIRDDIDSRVEALLRQLAGATPGAPGAG
jgi:arsenate reductase (thioredoxin)